MANMAVGPFTADAGSGRVPSDTIREAVRAGGGHSGPPIAATTGTATDAKAGARRGYSRPTTAAAHGRWRRRTKTSASPGLAARGAAPPDHPGQWRPVLARVRL